MTSIMKPSSLEPRTECAHRMSSAARFVGGFSMPAASPASSCDGLPFLCAARGPTKQSAERVCTSHYSILLRQDAAQRDAC